jgi:diguanylate cyclase (GGDEF)-like protein/PAS domain S-box-containing protein
MDLSVRRLREWRGDPLLASPGRLASVLFVLCGSLVAMASALPLPADADGRGIVRVGIAAIAVGVALWMLPWDRWRSSSTLLIVVPALVLIALHNLYTHADGFRFALFYLVLFAWVGLSHPPTTSLRLAPLLTISYVTPLFHYDADAAAFASMAYAVPVAVLVGETAAAVAGRIRRSETAVRSSEARWRSLVMNASDLILVLSEDGTVEYATPAMERLFGYPEESTSGMQVLDLVHPDDLAFVAERLRDSIERPGAGEHIELRVLRADGAVRWVESIGTNLLDEPTVGGIVCNVRDITDRKEAELVLIHRARTDSLTGLPNRRDLIDTTSTWADERVPFALALLDLDGFKEVNDALGHETGDRVLVEVAHRLRALAPSGDFVARLGGDEFAVLCRGVESTASASQRAIALHEVFVEPIEVDDMTLYVGASIGIALASDVRSPDVAAALLQHADVAMYRAKGADLVVAVFGIEDEVDRPARLAMASDLRAALDQGLIEAHFQPQLDLPSGTVRAVEALARWTRDGEAVPADRFIALAESTGLIRPLTATMLDLALAQCSAWAAAGLDIGVSVNVAAPTMRDPAFAESVARALRAHGVPPDRLTLEITESAFAEHGDSAVAVMHVLRAAGVRLSVDDFGSGYSSMAYLKRLPLDELKIDKVFVLEMLSDVRDQRITRSIIDLGHNLGLSVVAEGVESPIVADTLRSSGCDLLQGFGICRPMPGDALTSWLLERRRARAAV